MSSWLSLALALTARAVVNPRVALDLLTLAWALRRLGWWHTPPFLPLPPREYIAWRMHTAYGDANASPSVRDVLRFARWRRDLMRRW
jgi:hypothetical protein